MAGVRASPALAVRCLPLRPPHRLTTVAQIGNVYYFKRAVRNAMLAVKPCKNVSPPTGPISPLQNSPAVGTAPSASVSARAS